MVASVLVSSADKIDVVVKTGFIIKHSYSLRKCAFIWNYMLIVGESMIA
jgi:hypothetical protein